MREQALHISLQRERAAVEHAFTTFSQAVHASVNAV